MAATAPIANAVKSTCTLERLKYVEFVGQAEHPGRTTVLFAITSLTSGNVTGDHIEIEFGPQVHSVKSGQSYRVRAWTDDEGRLAAYFTTDDCGRPRSTYADGKSVDTAVLSNFKSRLPGVALASLGVLAIAMGVVYLLGRIRVLVVDERRVVAAPRRARR